MNRIHKDWRGVALAGLVFCSLWLVWRVDEWMLGARSEREVEESLVLGGVGGREISRVRITNRGGSVTLERVGDFEAREWRIVEPTAASGPADFDTIAVILQNVAHARRVNAFEGDDFDFARYGLDDPKTRATFVSEAGESQELWFGYSTTTGRYYARMADDSEIFLIEGYLKKRVDLPPGEFAYRRLLGGDAASVVAIEYATSPTLRFERDGASWIMSEPFEWDGDATELDQLATRLCRASAWRFPDPEARPAGLDRPTSGVRMFLAPGAAEGQPEVRELWLGESFIAPIDPADAATTASLRWVRGDGDRVMWASEQGLAALFPTRRDLVDERLITIPETRVARVEVRREGKPKFELARAAEGWINPEDPQAAIDSPSVDRELREALDIHFLRFAQDRLRSREDRQAFGFEPTKIRFIVYDVDGQSQSIELGGLNRDNMGEVFAQVKRRPAIVTIGVGEPHKLYWSADQFTPKYIVDLDPANVARWTLTDKNGTAAILERVGEFWHLRAASQPVGGGRRVPTARAEALGEVVSKMQYVAEYDTFPAGFDPFRNIEWSLAASDAVGRRLAMLEAGLDQGRYIYIRVDEARNLKLDRAEVARMSQTLRAVLGR